MTTAMIFLAIVAGLFAYWKLCTGLAGLADRLESRMTWEDYE